jgi:hypothetical protein
VTEEPDPERLLAEALRAQAVRAPLPDRSAESSTGSSDLMRLFSGSESQYALLSGQDSYGFEQPTSVPDSGYTTRLARTPPPPAPLSVWWIVLLAVLLGMAAGAVVGLVTVL